MINSSPVSCDVKPYRKAADVILLLIILPCLLSLINLNFAQDWKIHFFSVAIILAAVVFGAGGGLLAGWLALSALYTQRSFWVTPIFLWAMQSLVCWLVFFTKKPEKLYSPFCWLI